MQERERSQSSWTLPPVAAELVIGYASAAQPLPPRCIFLREPRRGKCRGTLTRRSGLLPVGRLLLRRDGLPHLNRGHRQELLVNEIGTIQIAVERRPALTQEIANALP